MQVARDMFLSPKRDMKRKMSEVYISLLMEAEFTKEEIFSLYVNRIFLGQRAYGVAAAAEVYFGKTLDQLSIAEMATIAGIPTAPSSVNPVASPQAATIRRGHVLGRMLELRYITPAEYETAKPRPWRAGCTDRRSKSMRLTSRRWSATRCRPDTATASIPPATRCSPPIDSRLEPAATVALRTGLLEYDRRHGWRGATDKVDLSKVDGNAGLEAELDERPMVGGLRPAIVEKVEGKTAKIYVKNLGSVTLPWEKMSWARRELPDEKTDRAPTQAAEIISRGDVIYTVGTTPPDPAIRAGCPRPRAPSSRWTRRTARWSRWSAASTTSRANTIA